MAVVIKLIAAAIFMLQSSKDKKTNRYKIYRIVILYKAE